MIRIKARYRSFQYRLLQRGIVTNVQLYQWNIVPSDLCYYCGRERETIIHLFWACENTTKLWDDYAEYIADRFGIYEPNLDVIAIITNRIVPLKNHVVNFLCLLVKQTIYAQRCLKKTLDFPAIKGKIEQVERIERYIATKNSKMMKHEKKWGQRNYQHTGDVGQFIQEYIEMM